VRQYSPPSAWTGAPCRVQGSFVPHSRPFRQPVTPSGVCPRKTTSSMYSRKPTLSVNGVNRLRYEPAHARDGCECESVAFGDVEGHPMSEKIGKGNILLLQPREFVNSRKRTFQSYTLQSFSPSTQIPRYVVISHVRSQEFGNTQSNSLPRCQLQKL
jgi:hypothetical protein